MTSIEIGLLSTLVLTIVATISSLLVLYAKVKDAIKAFVIVDENGKKKVNTFAILKVVIDAVAVAEKTGLAGEAKKDIALKTIQQALTSMGVEFDINEIGSSIDTIVNIINVFTKKK